LSLLNSFAGLWALYAEVAEEHDKRVVARWREEMDGTLIFVSAPFSFDF
jgi:hypothetical protein